jgi:hypothetical protein
MELGPRALGCNFQESSYDIRLNNITKSNSVAHKTNIYTKKLHNYNHDVSGVTCVTMESCYRWYKIWKAENLMNNFTEYWIASCRC